MNIRNSLLRVVLGTTLFAFAGLSARGELSGQDKALAIEAARANLYAQLIGQIKGLQVSETTIVANMAVEDANRAASVDGFIRGVSVGEPQFVGDMCLISGSITLQQVVENVNTLVRSGSGPAVAYEKVERLNNLRVVRAQGTGAVRARAPEAAPVANDEIETGLAETLGKLKGPGQLKLGAVEAARIDALAQLARQVKGVRISDSSVVFNMATESRWTDTETNALVQGAAVVRYHAVDGELVACTMQITLQQVVENIERTATRSTVGGLTVSERVQERIQRYNPALTRITATGYGAVRSAAAQAPAVAAPMIGTVK
jgi:hypothetical protein